MSGGDRKLQGDRLREILREIRERR